MTGPSVIRIRIESLRGEALAKLLFSVSQICRDDLLKGAMVSITENGIRIHRLPISTLSHPRVLYRPGSEGIIRRHSPLAFQNVAAMQAGEQLLKAAPWIGAAYAIARKYMP